MITIKELKDFLETLPPEFDNFTMVNGETFEIDDIHYARLDKPIISLSIDEETKELCLLHQSIEKGVDTDD